MIGVGIVMIVTSFIISILLILWRLYDITRSNAQYEQTKLDNLMVAIRVYESPMSWVKLVKVFMISLNDLDTSHVNALLLTKKTILGRDSYSEVLESDVELNNLEKAYMLELLNEEVG